MKKIIVSALSLLCVVGLVNAQSITETTTSFNKVEAPAVSLTMDISKKIMEEAVTKHFKADKQKGKSVGNMIQYANMTYPSMCVTKCDVYTKIEGSGKTSTLFVLVQRENKNFVVSGDEEIACIKEFMKTLSAEVTALDLQYQIEEQTKVYEKAVKEYEKLVSKKEELQKELKNTEKAISDADNEKKKQKSALDALQSKVKK